jgi:hypothetical protein
MGELNEAGRRQDDALQGKLGGLGDTGNASQGSRYNDPSHDDIDPKTSELQTLYQHQQVVRNCGASLGENCIEKSLIMACGVGRLELIRREASNR